MMKRKLIAKAALLAVLCATAGYAAAAKTLVFCSEGSPEGFNPQLFTTGTTFDASSVPMYNRLVEFELGTTKPIPGLAESWSVSEDGLTYTFKLRKGVKFHSSAKFKPTAWATPATRTTSWLPARASATTWTWAWTRSSTRWKRSTTTPWYSS